MRSAKGAKRPAAARDRATPWQHACPAGAAQPGAAGRRVSGQQLGVGRLCQSAQSRARTFLLFLMVTRVTPGTGFMPSFIIALRLFFSLRLCLEPASPPPASTARQPGRQATRDAGCRRRSEASARRCAGERRSAACSARRRTLSGVSQLRHVVVRVAVLLVVVLHLVDLSLRRRGAGAKRQRRRSLRRRPAGKCSPKAMRSVSAAFATRLAAAGAKRSERAPRPWRPASWSTECGAKVGLLTWRAVRWPVCAPLPPPLGRIGARRTARHVQGGC